MPECYNVSGLRKAPLDSSPLTKGQMDDDLNEILRIYSIPNNRIMSETKFRFMWNFIEVSN